MIRFLITATKLIRRLVKYRERDPQRQNGTSEECEADFGRDKYNDVSIAVILLFAQISFRAQVLFINLMADGPIPSVPATDDEWIETSFQQLSMLGV